MDVIRGIRYNADETPVEVVARVHAPEQRVETGHWVCRYDLEGLEDRYTKWTGNFADTARAMALGILGSTLFHAGVAVDGPSLALLAEGFQNIDDLPDNADLLKVRARIYGERRRPNGTKQRLIARIGPPRRDPEGSYMCPLYVPALRRKAYRLFGVDASQALEACLFFMESEFERHGVRRMG